MQGFSEELSRKPCIVAINKTDAFGSDVQDPLFKEFLIERGYADVLNAIKGEPDTEGPFLISAVAGQGLDALKSEIESRLKKFGPREIQNEISPELALGNPDLFE
jgi:hypothetical protein